MTAKEIADELRKLRESERNEIIAMFGGSEIYKEESKDEFMMEKRFAGGVFCSRCGSHHVAKNGKRANGRQNFLVHGLQKAVRINHRDDPERKSETPLCLEKVCRESYERRLAEEISRDLQDGPHRCILLEAQNP